MDEQTQSLKKSNLPIISAIVIVIIALAVGGYYFLNTTNQPTTGSEQMQSEETPSPTSESTTTPSQDAMTESPSAGSEKTFLVEGQNFSFSQKIIKVKKGDTVKITFTNKQGTHDFVIDEYDVRTKVLPTGQSETITFVADKTGAFEYYCNVGSHRAMGMKGSLVVE